MTSVYFRSSKPEDPASLRRQIYRGETFLLEPTPASQRLVALVNHLLEEALGPHPRRAQFRLSAEAFFERIGRLRRRIFSDRDLCEATRATLEAVSLNPSRCAFEPLRLRVVKSDGHLEPAARAVYHPHRDTWYAHPQSLIAFWVPLDDLSEEETFVFYPERFDVPVANDSDTFDYDEWMDDSRQLRVGWQTPTSGLSARYPSAEAGVHPGRPVGFSCRQGQNLLFSGAHFHQTKPQSTGRTRFSLDFRVVHLADQAEGLGAPNVDAHCRGSALRGYVHPAGE